MIAVCSGRQNLHVFEVFVLIVCLYCNSLSDEFYALFYLALYNEAFNRPSVAALYLHQALGTTYGRKSNDYMVSCARVQSKLLK